MAMRIPTSYATPAITELESADYVEYGEFDNIFDGQQFILNCAYPMLLDCFGAPLARANAAYVTLGAPYAPGLRAWKLDSQDFAGEDGTTGTLEIIHDCTVLAWASDGTTAGNIRLGTDGAGDFYEFGLIAGTTTPTWLALGAIDVLSNDAPETLVIDMKRTAGAGTMYVGAIFVLGNDP